MRPNCIKNIEKKKTDFKIYNLSNTYKSYSITLKCNKKPETTAGHMKSYS